MVGESELEEEGQVELQRGIRAACQIGSERGFCSVCCEVFKGLLLGIGGGGD